MNPILENKSGAIDFANITDEDIQEAAESIIANTRKSLKNIYDIPQEQRTFDNTMHALDGIYDSLEQVFSIIFLTAYVHPAEKPRNAALDKIPVLDKFVNELSLDQKLYKAVKAFSENPEGKNLTGYKEKFTRETVREFERNGLALPEEEREELKKIKDNLSESGAQFDQNIAASKDELIVTEEEIEGLPEDYKEERRMEDGNYKIDLSYPSYKPFMKYSHSSDARKKLMKKFLSRAADKNIAILDDILKYRNQIVKKLGYRSFAEYQLEDKMAKKPENVWEFEKNLREKVTPKAKKDYRHTLEKKTEITGNPDEDKVNLWESAYLNTRILKENYQVDQEQIKEYFPLDNVIKGLFRLSQELFNVEFREVEHPSVWHKEVRAFEVLKNNKISGRFYLDLFPRENKFKHAASFPLVSGRQTKDGYQNPAASLVCNFPRPTKDKPSLLPHNEVITLFHEFGHLMHDMLTSSPLSSFAGTSVSRDFVETPSQLFENWTWQYESLKLFAHHYETGEPLPKDIHDKMVAAQNVGSGNFVLQQLYYGMLDMTLHDTYNPESNETTTGIVKRLQNEITLFDYIEDTYFQAAFGHLNGYAAGYYGYMWAKVYAQDIFSEFLKSGVLNEETGVRLRDRILAKGATEEEFNLVKDFLNREPNEEAFLKSLGIED